MQSKTGYKTSQTMQKYESELKGESLYVVTRNFLWKVNHEDYVTTIV